MSEFELNALALEYQRDYGTASRELDISDFVNNPFINCETSILTFTFPKELSDFPFGKIGMLGDDVPDSFLVTQKTI